MRGERDALYILYTVQCEEDAALQNLVKSEVPIKEARKHSGRRGGYLVKVTRVHTGRKKIENIMNFSTEKIHL
jgi:hypothetical protein